MNRRGFLGAILAAGVAPAIVRVESLMRLPSVIIPTDAEITAVVSGNRLLTIEMITREALHILESNLTFTRKTMGVWPELN